MTSIDWRPPGIRGESGDSFSVRHIWCVGRNYADHAREMGSDPGREPPVFFAKPAASITADGRIAYPPSTAELHHEVELVVLLGAGGARMDAAAAARAIAGYAVGVDLTRRDVQARARQGGMPWELSKGFERSAPVGPWVPAAQWRPDPEHRLALTVNGRGAQRDVLGSMIWPVDELLARLSAEMPLHPGDVVFTGTPAGVGPLAVGDTVHAVIDGLPALDFEIVASR